MFTYISNLKCRFRLLFQTESQKSGWEMSQQGVSLASINRHLIHSARNTANGVNWITMMRDASLRRRGATERTWSRSNRSSIFVLLWAHRTHTHTHQMIMRLLPRPNSHLVTWLGRCNSSMYTQKRGHGLLTPGSSQEVEEVEEKAASTPSTGDLQPIRAQEGGVFFSLLTTNTAVCTPTAALQNEISSLQQGLTRSSSGGDVGTGQRIKGKAVISC